VESLIAVTLGGSQAAGTVRAVRSQRTREFETGFEQRVCCDKPRRDTVAGRFMGREYLRAFDVSWGHEPVFLLLFIERPKAIRRRTKRRRKMESRFMKSLRMKGSRFDRNHRTTKMEHRTRK